MKIIIIPIGGIGERFQNAGYKLPKPLINVAGKPIVHWLIESLDLTNINMIYIPYNKHLKKYRFEDNLIHCFPHIKFKFMCLEHATNGAAETVKNILEYYNLQLVDDTQVACIDSDIFFTTNVLKMWDGSNTIFTFNDCSNQSIYSYVKLDGDKIIDIKEKQKISSNACCGIYAFNSIRELYESCVHIILNNINQKGEFYISCIIGHMLSLNKIFYNKIILKDEYHCLGTPLQIKMLPDKLSSINKKRYCFDLDNTLVTFPKISNDYTSVEPIQQNIDILKKIKLYGNTIIIYTARNMKTYNGNVGKACANIGKITFDTLEKFNIPYDEIYFGKPMADFYIDDLAVSSYENLEKIIGFYEINTPSRHYNNVEIDQIDIIKKSSDNLEGEIFYYKSLKQMEKITKYFPVFIDCDTNNKWYTIEKINGITISKLYLSEELTFDTLNNLMDVLAEIQLSYECDQSGINIYENYSNKIINRYTNYDFTKFNNHAYIFEMLTTNMKIYETENKGCIKVIHGDPVFTNIFIDIYGKIKFIDMRGKLGNTLTVFGDWLYDWAKLYQSLIGYDEILHNVEIDIIYKNKMIEYFRNKFTTKYSGKDFENLRMITKSLLFTLIPLHNNNKCEKYYDLINCV